MSRTTLIAIWPGEKTEEFMELRNSWGSAPPVWRALGMRWLGNEMIVFSGADDLWKLWEALYIPEYQRAVLMMTFDHGYVSQKNYARAISDIESFFKDFPMAADNVNHWPEICKAFKDNPQIPAFGLWCTSVSENPWRGNWNEQLEDYDHVDWAQCFEVYEALDSLNMPDGGTKTDETGNHTCSEKP